MQAEAIHAIRRDLERAENVGDAAAIAGHLAGDVVVIVPDFPVMRGRDEVSRFLHDLLPGLHEHFDRRISYTSVDVQIDGDDATDWGEFAFTVQPRAGGALERVTGKYVWKFRRGAKGAWKCVQMLVVRDEGTEPERADVVVPSVRPLVWFTTVFLSVYAPLETLYSLPALWNPFYLVDFIAMVLLGIGVWCYFARGASRLALPWLVAGYAWSGANAWRAMFGRIDALSAGGSLRFGSPELALVVLGTVLSIACLLWSLRLVAIAERE